MKIFIRLTIISYLVLLICSLITNRHSRWQQQDLRHSRWQQQDRKLSQITDVTWNYCDVKCTYLQILYPENDFVILYFQGIKNQQKFGVCYVKQQEKYILWNKVVKNQFYQKTCGIKDDKDYMKMENQYKLKSILAIGKGTQLPVKYSPFEANHQ